MVRIFWVNMVYHENSEDPDQTPQNAQSNQGIYCLPFIKQCYKILRGSSILEQVHQRIKVSKN